jgi:hypothetical protein
MAESRWGLCKDCKWWQIEPAAKIANTAMGLCIDEDLQKFRLRVSGNSGCNRFIEGRPARQRFGDRPSHCTTNTLNVVRFRFVSESQRDGHEKSV